MHENWETIKITTTIKRRDAVVSYTQMLITKGIYLQIIHAKLSSNRNSYIFCIYKEMYKGNECQLTIQIYVFGIFFLLFCIFVLATHFK